MIDDISLKNLTVDYNNLTKLGFINKKEYYYLEKDILNNRFKIIIKIDKNNIITSDCIDLEINDKLIPYYVKDSDGEFIGKIKDEYNNIIKKIINTCTTKYIYQSEYTNLIIKYIKEKYGDELEFLWETSKTSAIWRNKINNKWYGIIMVIMENRLGIESLKEVEVINLAYNTDKIEELINNINIFRGYHMNKKHWITIKLDGSLPIEKIYELIDISYHLSVGNKRNKC